MYERRIFSCLDTNNFGAFGGDNAMGSGGPPPPPPAPRSGPPHRGGNRGGGGNVSDAIINDCRRRCVLFLAHWWTFRR